MPVTRNQSNAASQAKLSAPSTSETSTSKDSSDQGGTSGESEQPPRHDSPENCSICLGPFNNKSFTSSCAHSFCFVCLKQWSKVKAECPLCKQPFTSIFYNIRSNQQYDIYELPHQQPNQIDYNIFNYVSGPIPSFAGPTHHLFNLSHPFDADLTLSNFSRFQFRHRRYDRLLNPLGIHGEHAYSFGGQMSSGVDPTTHISATTWPRGAEEFRREVYRSNLGPPAVILGNENTRYRLTPQMVAASAHRIHRIMPWLTRELRVLLRTHQNVRLAISIIQPLLSQVTIDSLAFYDKVAPLIGRRSRLFVQEFVAFANSALNIQAYDRKAMYRRRDSATAVPSSSSSTSSDEVVEVTDFSPSFDPIQRGPLQSQPLNLTYPSTIIQGTSQAQPLNLSRSGWDSPLPGPSWETMNIQESAIDRVSVSSESDDPVFRPDLRNSDSEESKAGSDLIFVKYDKPWNERSPINLTTDSEPAEASGEVGKKKKSKHRKKKRDSGELEEVTKSKKDKIKKSVKSKHRDKPRNPLRVEMDSDEEESTTEGHKRRHSQSSVEHHRTKKRKKSKSKREKPPSLSDREIVDRYFAEAMLTQQPNTNDVDVEGTETSGKGKKREKRGTESLHDKSKKKKKSKKHSKDSRHQSPKHYKKHPSGHKKTSNRLAEVGVSDQHQRHFPATSPIRHNPLPGTGRSDRVEPMATDDLSQHEASNSAMSHSVVPNYQPSYLSMPDTVQHIPVNLWVSTWPALSVSHTYPPPAPLPVGQNIPQSSSSSTFASNSNITTTNKPTLSISSSSSSDSSSTESDDAQDLHIPPLQNIHSRTKQWLETNFPELGRPSASQTFSSTDLPPASSASLTYNPSTSIAMNKSYSIPQSNNADISTMQKEKASSDVEVVSIPSGDEDILICSSDDDSTTKDLWVIGEESSNRSKRVRKTAPSNSKNGDASSSACTISALSFTENRDKYVESSKTTTPQNIVSSLNKPFQPFKLSKKVSLPLTGNDPFFPLMHHSSDDDGDTGSVSQPQGTVSSQPTQSSSNSKNVTSNDANLSEFIVDILDNNYPSNSNLTPSTAGTSRVSEMREAALQISQGCSAPLGTTSANLTTAFQLNNSQSSNQTSANTSRSINNEAFSTFPPLTSSLSSAKPGMSGISYLPYANLPPTTTMSSALPCYMPPQQTLPTTSISLPLSLPFTNYAPVIASNQMSSERNVPSLTESNLPSLSATGNLSLLSESNLLSSHSTSEGNLLSLTSAGNLLSLTSEGNLSSLPSEGNMLSIPLGDNLPLLSSENNFNLPSESNLRSLPSDNNLPLLPVDTRLPLTISSTSSMQDQLVGAIVADTMNHIENSNGLLQNENVGTMSSDHFNQYSSAGHSVISHAGFQNSASFIDAGDQQLQSETSSSFTSTVGDQGNIYSSYKTVDCENGVENLVSSTMQKEDTEMGVGSKVIDNSDVTNTVLSSEICDPNADTICISETYSLHVAPASTDVNNSDNLATNLNKNNRSSNVSVTSTVPCISDSGDGKSQSGLPNSDNEKLFDALYSTDESFQEDADVSKPLQSSTQQSNEKTLSTALETVREQTVVNDSATMSRNSEYTQVQSIATGQTFNSGIGSSSTSGINSSEGSTLFKPYIDQNVKLFTDALASSDSSSNSSSSAESEFDSDSEN